ncbi:uncharacterized protein [Aristolochia californica]|uniref:uncharacterized protein n=1 Tax=Aristolochia californica TaxID=171875 RepID=UPI0035DA6C73
MTAAHSLAVGCGFPAGDHHLRMANRRRIRPSFCAAAAPAALDRLEVMRVSARESFVKGISFSKCKDEDISLAKALLLAAAEDEAFVAFDRRRDVLSFYLERADSVSATAMSLEEPKAGFGFESCPDTIPLSGKTISEWIAELDSISKQVEAELESDSLSRDIIGSHLVKVFESRGFKRCPAEEADPKFSYLHSVLSSGCGSSILLGIIYIEVYKRLGITLGGYRIGNDLWIWPQTWDPEELFKVSSGGGSPPGRTLEIATNRDIIGIALSDLIKVHWKRASRMNRGLRLTSPLRPASGPLKVPLLRPQDLKLAVMASERLLVLQPHNWALRRDHGMLLFYSKRYREAVQELSICMAFAPAEEAEVLEHFVEKLHLMRIESSWKSFAVL